ncbi:alcohol acetyltransferase [Dactylonectria macrodidyma]|uniref:Alcohol acetyltransferase n=1 Tax=Dactylonectria macrodidyma TaxID=307937 RepID=A0A9P9F151_9HYPO|nr:alcohol acetyltransferase [Dactylonectria macrodidyma]
MDLTHIDSLFQSLTHTDSLDRMFYLQHIVGAQANVLVSAHYAPTTSTYDDHLSKEAVYSAIRSIITVYPELSLIGIPQPLAKTGHHTLFLAALHEIDLGTCVEFLDDEAPMARPEVIERLHNHWDWADDELNPRKPWWRVVILGRQEVIFIFHHLICDGRFGYIFHRQFLAAINSFNEQKRPCSRIIKIDPERVKLSREMEEFWNGSTSPLRFIHVLFMFLLLRLFFGRRLLFTSLPKPKSNAKSVIAKAGPEHRTKTRIATLRITASRMRRILAACREHNTTFTPLLIVIILCTLACDYYPKAKIGISNCAIDMRSLYPAGMETKESGKFLQHSSGTSKFTWLDRYRRVFHPRSSDNAHSKAGSKITNVDVDGAWELVRGYRVSIKKAFEGDNLVIPFRAANAVSDDLESTLSSSFPALGLHLNNSIQVSNLGAFSTGDQGGRWKIDDVSFSASAVNGNISYNIAFNVASVEGGDTVICASYEDGILAKEMVSGILEAALEKLEAIL